MRCLFVVQWLRYLILNILKLMRRSLSEFRGAILQLLLFCFNNIDEGLLTGISLQSFVNIHSLDLLVRLVNNTSWVTLNH